MKRPRKEISAAKLSFEPDSDEHFAYIVGYTESGFPYGITWEEIQEIEMVDKKPGAGKPSDDIVEFQPEPFVRFLPDTA